MQDTALPTRERKVLEPKGNAAHARKLEKLREIEKSWFDCWTGEPYRNFLPKEIRPREMVDGKKALYGNTEARILENEEWSSNLVDALHHMSELMQGNVISAQARLTEAVQYRQVFGSVGQGQLANQYVLEVMPSDVWNVIAKMR